MALVRQRLYAVMPLRHLLPVGDEDAETPDRHRLLAADAATGRDGARQATPQRPGATSSHSASYGRLANSFAIALPIAANTPNTQTNGHIIRRVSV